MSGKSARTDRPKKRAVTRLSFDLLARDDEGLTLIEIMVIATLISILTTLSMMSFRSFRQSSDHRGAARETVAMLRNAQTQAVGEGVTTECRFTTSRVEIYKGICPGCTLIRSYELPSNLQYVYSGSYNGETRGFTHPGEAANTNTHDNCLFYPRGSATGGRIGVKRIDRGTELKVELESLTGRVKYCADPSPSAPC